MKIIKKLLTKLAEAIAERHRNQIGRIDYETGKVIW